MTRQLFTERIESLKRQVVVMAARSEAMLGRSVRALSDLDLGLCADVIAEDDQIDAMELALQRDCLECLALDQPMASDLRRVGAILKISSDLERIADLSVDIARIARHLDMELGDPGLVDFPQMAGTARMMLRSVTQSFSAEDATSLEAIVEMEDQVDELHRLLCSQVRDMMRNDPGSAVAASWMLLALHHIERAADHAVSIASSVEFIVTGRLNGLAQTHRPITSVGA